MTPLITTLLAIVVLMGLLTWYAVTHSEDEQPSDSEL
jgi:hypothetical protein